MKNYFLRLLGYDKFANLQTLQLVFEANNPELPVKLIAHSMAAQQVWLNRCKGLTSSNTVLWPDWRADTLQGIIIENNRAWVDFVNTLDDKDFDKTIRYKDTKGNEHQNKLIDIIAHLINHGTHHRAQIGQNLKIAGIENLPISDYIFYLRQL